MDSGGHKLFVVKDGPHTYYVQEMPGYYGVGRDYAVMKDRKRYYAGRFAHVDLAIEWLLKQLLQDRLIQLTLDL